MSVSIEWVGAKDAYVGFILPGQDAADGQTVEEDEGIGLQILGDDGICIVGEPGAIRSLAMKMIRATVLAEVKISENQKKAKKK